MMYDVTPQLPHNGFTVAELFCGGGLMGVGLKTSGFNIVWANDFDKNAVKAYRHNLGDHVIHADITTIDPRDIPDVDVIAGGPPCQDYSVAGKGKGEKGERGRLVFAYLDIIKAKRPKAFLFENVKGLVGKKHRHTFDKLLEEFNRIGYRVSWKVLNAWDYGVAQKRERVFIVGVRNDLGFSFVFPEPEPEDYRTKVLRDVIGDLPEPRMDERNPEDGQYSSRYLSRNRVVSWDAPSYTILTSPRDTPIHPGDGTVTMEDVRNHRPRELTETELAFLERNPVSIAKNRPVTMDEPSRTIPAVMHKGVPYGLFYPNHEYKPLSKKAIDGAMRRKLRGNFGSALRHQSWDKPAGTLTCQIAKDPTTYLPPAESMKNIRRFTVRECLRIQSVPDWYVLPDDVSLSAQYRIVGNGVPCRVAWYLGRALADQLKEVRR